MDIKVSVVTPFYNGLPYLEECVSSVMAQSLKEIELILVDDGSTDGSGELADTFAQADKRITVIHQKNAGVSAARNAALDIAGGEFIGFIDADDFADADMLEKLYAAALEHNVEIVAAGFTVDNQMNHSTKRVASHFETERILGKADILQYASKMHSVKCFNYFWRNLYSCRLIKENGIRFEESISVGEDTLFCMECFLIAERAVSVDIAAYHYRIHPSSCMRQKYKPLLAVSFQRQFEKKLALSDTYLGDYKTDFRKEMARYTIESLLPLAISNIYGNDVRHKQSAYKHIIKLSMIQKSLSWFDINDIRTKSLDWVSLWLASKNLLLFSHWVCKYIFYRQRASKRLRKSRREGIRNGF